MAKLFQTSQADDFYTQPIFPLRDRLRRLGWNVACSLFFKPSPRPFFSWRAWILRRFGARIGQGTYIYPTAKIWAPWHLRVDDTATIGPGAELYNPGGITLEHHAIVSQDAFLCGGTHDFNNPAFPMIWKPIALEPYAWICARAVVLPGVTVGRGAVLGAGAVTSKNLESLGVYAGNPAQRVSTRTLTMPSDREETLC